jgi:hypothetical protein
MEVNIDNIEQVAQKFLSGKDNVGWTGEFYKRRLRAGYICSSEDKLIINYIKNNFNNKKDIIFEPGCGLGQLVLALGVFGFEGVGFDHDRKRHENSLRLKAEFCKSFGPINISFSKKSYPDVTPKATLLVCNNFCGTYVKQNEDRIIKSFAKYPNVILNIKMFGFVRNEEQQRGLLKSLSSMGFRPKNIFRTIYLLEK